MVLHNGGNVLRAIPLSGEVHNGASTLKTAQASQKNMTDALTTVLARQKLADFRLQFPVPGVYSGAQRSLGSTAVTHPLQDPLHVAHAIGFLDVLHRGQRLVI